MTGFSSLGTYELSMNAQFIIGPEPKQGIQKNTVTPLSVHYNSFSRQRILCHHPDYPYTYTFISARSLR